VRHETRSYVDRGTVVASADLPCENTKTMNPALRVVARGAAYIDSLFGTLMPKMKYRLRIPPEVREAVANRWFPTGGRVLDIGCGTGWIAVWLAEQGYRVVGIDYAAAAIDLARSAHPEMEDRLQWMVLDIVHDPPPRHDFDALLDRGCFHRMPRRFWPIYAEKVRACAKPGAPFLLLMGTRRHSTFQPNASSGVDAETKGDIERAFAPFFLISRTEDSYVEQPSGKEGPHRPGAAFWMTAR
jgi:SAM-dependent methyltransferase